MSINIGNEPSEVTIFKDEKGRYSCSIGIREPDETGKFVYIKGAYSKSYKKVVFNKGVEVKNKTKIRVIKGWFEPYRLPKKDEYGEAIEDKNGNVAYEIYDKYRISQFEILEEGTDEVQKTRQPKQEPQDSFAFDNTIDELPF